MAKSSKPKKKYVPKMARVPSMVTQMNSFIPFEKALWNLLETGEGEVDEVGNLIFHDDLGKVYSFVSSLNLYIQIVKIYATKKELDINLRPMYILQNRMYECLGFDEEEVDEGRKQFEICKDIICKIKPSLLMEILDTIRISINLDTVVKGSLKEPEVMLRRIINKVGELTYEEVLEKNKYFQDRYMENPTDEHIKKLRDTYLEYQSAYCFARMNQI